MTDFFSVPTEVDAVRAEIAELREGDARWDDPRNLRASYFAGDAVVRLAADAFSAYQGVNAIYGALAYPSLRRLEADVVGALLTLFHAPEGAVGSVTTGGTESIFMAMKTARDWARVHRPSSSPTVVIPRSGHAAFNKAAALLGMRVSRTPIGDGYRADVDAMARAIDANTVMLVGSAPPYAYGVVDPIAAIAELAEARGLWLHVDGCVGGMVLPFVKELGHAVPTFDFALPALASLSVDLHKYGYALHGCSALLLRTPELAGFQGYAFDDWPVGHYSTTNLAGSRGGGPIASAWAVMRHLGHTGFRDRVASMLAAKLRFVAGIEGIPGLEIFGRPEGPHFSFGSTAVDMAAVGQEMSRRGWSYGPQVNPPGMILLLNARHGEVVDEFVRELTVAVEGVRAGQIVARPSRALYTV